MAAGALASPSSDAGSYTNLGNYALYVQPQPGYGATYSESVAQDCVTIGPAAVSPNPFYDFTASLTGVPQISEIVQADQKCNILDGKTSFILQGFGTSSTEGTAGPNQGNPQCNAGVCSITVTGPAELATAYYARADPTITFNLGGNGGTSTVTVPYGSDFSGITVPWGSLTSWYNYYEHSNLCGFSTAPRYTLFPDYGYPGGLYSPGTYNPYDISGALQNVRSSVISGYGSVENNQGSQQVWGTAQTTIDNNLYWIQSTPGLCSYLDAVAYPLEELVISENGAPVATFSNIQNNPNQNIVTTNGQFTLTVSSSGTSGGMTLSGTDLKSNIVVTPVWGQPLASYYVIGADSSSYCPSNPTTGTAVVTQDLSIGFGSPGTTLTSLITPIYTLPFPCLSGPNPIYEWYDSYYTESNVCSGYNTQGITTVANLETPAVLIASGYADQSNSQTSQGLTVYGGFVSCYSNQAPLNIQADAPYPPT